VYRHDCSPREYQQEPIGILRASELSHRLSIGWPDALFRASPISTCASKDTEQGITDKDNRGEPFGNKRHSTQGRHHAKLAPRNQAFLRGCGWPAASSVIPGARESGVAADSSRGAQRFERQLCLASLPSLAARERIAAASRAKKILQCIWKTDNQAANENDRFRIPPASRSNLINQYLQTPMISSPPPRNRESPRRQIADHQPERTPMSGMTQGPRSFGKTKSEYDPRKEKVGWSWSAWQ